MSTADTPAPIAMSARQWLMLLLLGLLWGGSFFFARIAVLEIPPLALVLLRVMIAAAVLHLYLAARRISFAPVLAMAGAFAVLALLNNVIPFTLMFYGQTELGAGLASILNATTPFWTILLANLLTTDERLSARKLGGVAIGVAGTALMIGPGLANGVGGPAWAKMALIGTALSYGFAAIFARRFRTLRPPVVATGQLTASTLIMIPIVLVAGGLESAFEASGAAWGSVAALAVASTAFAYILFFSLIASAGATNASLVTLIVPVFAMLLGTIVLQERLAGFEIAGMVVIGLGLLVVDGRFLSQRR